MPPLTHFDITFEKNMDVFQAGQIVRGQVEVDLKEDMKMRLVAAGIQVVLKGEARSRWWKGERNNAVLFISKELYFHHAQILWAPDQDKKNYNPLLPAGQHAFPFEYQLPSTGLPTSFEGANGFVRYSAEAIIDQPRGTPDKKFKKIFTVLDMYDLNEDPEAMTPSGAEGSKTLGILFFESDPIEVQVQTDRGAYCPGETIKLTGTIKNGSGTDIRQTTVQLIQTVACTAQARRMGAGSETETRYEDKTLNEVKTTVGCKAKATADLSAAGIALPVPAVPPSLKRYCSFINVYYRVRFIVNIPGLHKNLEVDIPITIGVIPLKSYYPQAPSFPLHPVEQPPQYPDVGFAQWTYSTANDPDGPPPPYYEVAKAGPAKISKEEEDKDADCLGPKEFAPKYAYYDWSKSP